MNIHEYLEIAEKPGRGKIIVCRKCGYEFCGPEDNYKLHALYREVDLNGWPKRKPSSDDPMFIVYQEYICPGCGVLLEVDNYCPALDSEEDKILWDIQLDV